MLNNNISFQLKQHFFLRKVLLHPLPVMSGRISFHSQLSSIMETMAKSALSRICKLVDEDSAELQMELSRLLFANSALAEKVNSLECELTIVRTDAPKLSKCRSIGVQTVCHRGEDAHDVTGPPTIDGIFGKDWCMNLWKDRDPYNLQKFTDSAQFPEKSGTTMTDTVPNIKDEGFVQEVATRCQQETLSTEAENEESTAEEPQQLSMGYSDDGGLCSLSFGQSGEQVVSAECIEENTAQLISNDTEVDFSSHIIPIEDDDDDDDDIQFVQASQQEPAINAGVGSSHDKQETLPEDNPGNSNTLDKDLHNNFNVLKVKTSRALKTGKFTCQICNRTFFHKGTLTHHMKSHKSNFCNICKQHFPHRYKFNSHTCVPPVPTRRVSNSCELCGKTFANPSALKIHYVVHTGEKPYRCSMCGKGFTQKGNLKCHLRIHTGERPFHCVKCGKNFTQKVNLNHHLMAHLNHEFVGERPINRKQQKNMEAKTVSDL